MPRLPSSHGSTPPPGQGSGSRHDQGFALVIVISAIGLLALAAAGFAQVTRSQVRAAASAVGSSTAQALADSGVELAVLELVLARQDPAYQRRFAVSEQPYVCDAGDGRRLAVSITDEAGKVDLNAAGNRLLQALLAGVGAPASEALADAIIDFRDDDSIKRPQGAERDDYRAAGRPGPKNAPFSVVEEIEQVLGIDSALAARLRPHVTVYSAQPGIDTASASRQLIAILAHGLNNDSGPTEPASGGSDDRGVTTPLPFAGAQGRRFFAVHAEAFALSSAFVREAIVELGQNRARPFTFLRWYRGALKHGEAALQANGIDSCP